MVFWLRIALWNHSLEKIRNDDLSPQEIEECKDFDNFTDFTLFFHVLYV